MQTRAFLTVTALLSASSALGIGVSIVRQKGLAVVLGVVFARSTLVGAATQFATRALVGRALGTAAAGFYHASRSVAELYLTYLSAAFSAEYYPRISMLSTDPHAMGRAVAEQTRLVVGLVAPIVFAAIVLAPVAVHLLYDSRFDPMLAMLRAQLAGDGDVVVPRAQPHRGALLGLVLLKRGRVCGCLHGGVAFGAPRFELVVAGWGNVE